ncbi:MAG TPA: serine/threonine-protein kinase [Verrucomicrobiales bacterium]|jgi:serine/threonine-protein kinase|nr:serine/threonine-protein kinase [Verrucomicrobiales bacterium]
MNVDPQWIARKFPGLNAIARLTTGGQKAVFAAEHPEHGAVVFKMIHPSQGEQSVQRERLAVERVQSPRVPRILDAGEIAADLGPCFWFLEQRIQGLTLGNILRRDGPFDTETTMLLGAQMLEAINAAEEVHIVHRDIKPDNIMLDDGGNFWLLDFGIARHLTLTAITDIESRWGKFTPGYAPPEQFRNLQSEIDSRADLFALGITLYECRTGTNPFWSGVSSPLEVLRRVEGMPLPRLGVNTVPDEFADFVAVLAQRRRDHRPRTAGMALQWINEIREKYIV